MFAPKLKLVPIVVLTSAVILGISGCFEAQSSSLASGKADLPAVRPYQPSKDFNAYWYAGQAELCSYDFIIDRYGELRKGYAVAVFVTEDFSKSKQVKLDNVVPSDAIPVLKLNAIQRFETGVYDYSVMQSVFTPIDYKTYPNSLKWNTTVQDWCGQVFTQLNLVPTGYKVSQFSYFETEGDEQITTATAMLESELFTRLRIDPASIVSGSQKMIADLSFSRLRHKPVAAITANVTNDAGKCTVVYPELKRQMEIQYETKSPHTILGWKETTTDGKLISEAKLRKQIKSAYWAHHSEIDAPLRKELGL
jgi:hypothetical protein